MAYDSKYKTGMSWLNDSEDDPCSPKILTALYAAIFDTDADPDVVSHLMHAYEIQHGIDHEDALEPKCLGGDDAWKFMRDQVWLPEFKRQLTRLDVPWDDRGIENSEAFEWPQCLPNRPIRIGILRAIGRRMAVADAWLTKSLREAAKQSAA